MMRFILFVIVALLFAGMIIPPAWILLTEGKIGAGLVLIFEIVVLVHGFRFVRHVADEGLKVQKERG